MPTELFKKYRPRTLDQIVGSAPTVAALERMIADQRVPQFMLFHGPSGCGKTTLARIMCRAVGITREDYTEINAADTRGVDTVRDIRARMHLRPLTGTGRAWVIDEAQKLTNDAQNALLKITEEPPPGVRFMICTTDPPKIISTIRNRATDMRVFALNEVETTELVTRVAEAEGIVLADGVVHQIHEVCEGSARRALVVLEKLFGVIDPADQLAIVGNAEASAAGIEIARAVYGGKTQWATVAKLLKANTEEPETIRHIIMGYGNSILLSGKTDKRVAAVLDCFLRPFYDSKKAGLTMACFEAVNGRA